MSEYYKDIHRYDDILHMEYDPNVCNPTNRARMSLHDRAAQFAPFIALNGHEEAMEETKHLAEERIRISEMGIKEV